MKKDRIKQAKARRSGVSGVFQYVELLKIEKPKHEPIQPIILKINPTI